MEDVFRGINDTSNPAILTGKLLSQGRLAAGYKGTTCHMHAQELALKHAFGLVKRKKKNVPVDWFEPGERITKKCKKLISEIMNKKSKRRWQEFKDIGKKYQKAAPIKLVKLADTRVSGCFLMFQSLLRCKCLIDMLPTKACESHYKIYQPHIPSKDEWIFISEVEAVLQITNELAMKSQMEGFGEISYSWMNVAMAKYKLQNDKLPLRCVAISSSIWAPNMTANNLERIDIPRESLSEDTKKFIARLIENLDDYFLGPDDDQLVSMKLHPLIQASGFR